MSEELKKTEAGLFDVEVKHSISDTTAVVLLLVAGLIALGLYKR